MDVRANSRYILLIKSNINDKLDEDCVRTKLHRYLISAKLDPYELKKFLFDLRISIGVLVVN